MRYFRVSLCGTFHTFVLQDERGRCVEDLAQAIEMAESQYGEEWAQVFNGRVGAARVDANLMAS